MLNDVQLAILEAYLVDNLDEQLLKLGVTFSGVEQMPEKKIIAFYFDIPNHGKAHVMMFEAMVLRSKLETVGSEIISILIKTMYENDLLETQEQADNTGWGSQGEASEPSEDDITNVLSGFEALLGNRDNNPEV